MKNHNSFILIVVAFFLLFFVGCEQPQTGNTVSSAQARTSQSVFFGTIVGLSDALIANEATGVGTVAGGVAGGVAGSTVGGGRGSTLAAVGGALAGAAIGSAIENSARRTEAIEIIVRLESGETIAVVQEIGNEERSMRVGDQVRVIRGANGFTRVRLN